MPAQPPNRSPDDVHISARDARGGEIILRTRTRRIVFIAGLAGFVILAILGWFAMVGA